MNPVAKSSLSTFQFFRSANLEMLCCRSKKRHSHGFAGSLVPTKTDGKMKVTQRRIWVFGVIAAVAAVVVLLLNRSADELTVHLVDNRLGKAISGVVEVDEFRQYPVLSSVEFLPGWLRGSRRVYSAAIRDGTFKLRKLKTIRQSALLRIRAPEGEIDISYQAWGPDGRATMGLTQFFVRQEEVVVSLDEK
jgi:hypothetical protein